MKDVYKTLREQFEVFRDRKRDESTDEVFEWRNVRPKLLKKQCAKWRMWEIDDELVSEQWKSFDRFEVYQNSETLLYRDKTSNIFRTKGDLSDSIDIKPLVNKDYSIARFKSFIDKMENTKTSMIMNRLFRNDLCLPEIIDSSQSQGIKVKANQIVSLIGAPGTGKSTKLASIVDKLNKTRKIVYFAPTHSQISNFAKKLEDRKIDFAIMSDESKVDEQFIRRHRCNIEKVKGKYKNTIPTGIQVILSTINKPIKLIHRANIDVVLLDEASKISLLEAFTTLFQIDTLKLLVVGGDNRQIGCEGPKFTRMANILEYIDKMWQLFEFINL